MAHRALDFFGGAAAVSRKARRRVLHVLSSDLLYQVC
jgi:hypothetical protein